MTDSPTFPNAIACQHGALRRVCEICERDDEIKTLTRERDEAITALAESHAAQLRNEKALCAQIERLRTALAQIVSCVPAIQDGGGFIIEHFDSDGEYVGSQQVNPDSIIQEMQFIATEALTAEKTS